MNVTELVYWIGAALQERNWELEIARLQHVKWWYNAHMTTKRESCFAAEAVRSASAPESSADVEHYAYDKAGRLVREGCRTYRYGYLDKVLAVTEGKRAYKYDYHVDGKPGYLATPKGHVKKMMSFTEPVVIKKIRAWPDENL